MITLQIRLYGILRDTVASADRGQLCLTVNDSTTIQELLDILDVAGLMNVAVNDELVHEWGRPLQDGDNIKIFRPSVGG